MWDILIFFAAGVLLGWLLREKKKLARLINRITSVLLGTLIFLLGVSAGNHPDVASNFPRLGLTAIVLALGALVGSVIFVLPIATRIDKEAK